MNKICKSVKTYQVFQHLWNCIEERKKEVETMLKMVIAKNSQICLKYILRYM